jgi:hypothetical protein
LAAHTTSAGELTQSASADRPDGNVTVVRSIQFGANFGSRFW